MGGKKINVDLFKKGEKLVRLLEQQKMRVSELDELYKKTKELELLYNKIHEEISDLLFNSYHDERQLYFDILREVDDNENEIN